jgi:aminoglycoside phosphotransferase (APT) family kinase protein
LRSEFFGGAWSHGDANLANFLFSENENRALLIDFELAHPRDLSADQRHAEDLLTFLQDLLGCCTREEDWVPFARRFLDAYGDNAPTEILRARMAIPRGIPRVWWWIRTNYISAATLRRRVAALREMLGEYQARTAACAKTI